MLSSTKASVAYGPIHPRLSSRFFHRQCITPRKCVEERQVYSWPITWANFMNNSYETHISSKYLWDLLLQTNGPLMLLPQEHIFFSSTAVNVKKMTILLFFSPTRKKSLFFSIADDWTLRKVPCTLLSLLDYHACTHPKSCLLFCRLGLWDYMANPSV